MSDKQKTLAEAKRLNQRIGLKLRELRILHHMSQERLGQGLGLSFQQIQKYENGVNRLSAARLIQVAAFFDVPVLTFFDGLIEGGAGKGQKQSGQPFDQTTLKMAGILGAISDEEIKLVCIKLIKVLAKK